MKRLSKGSCSDILMTALEEAEDMKNVIILWEKEGEAGYFCNETQTMETGNFLVDRFKSYILQHICECENCSENQGE